MASELGLYIGNSLEATGGGAGGTTKVGEKLIRNSSLARDVLGDLYIFWKTKQNNTRGN